MDKWMHNWRIGVVESHNAARGVNVLELEAPSVICSWLNGLPWFFFSDTKPMGYRSWVGNTNREHDSYIFIVSESSIQLERLWRTMAGDGAF